MSSSAESKFSSEMSCKDVCGRWVGWCDRKDCNLRGRQERNFFTRSARRWLREPLCSAEIHSPLGPFSRRVESLTGGNCLDGHGLRSTGHEFFSPLRIVTVKMSSSAESEFSSEMPSRDKQFKNFSRACRFFVSTVGGGNRIGW